MQITNKLYQTHSPELAKGETGDHAIAQVQALIRAKAERKCKLIKMEERSYYENAMLHTEQLATKKITRLHLIQRWCKKQGAVIKDVSETTWVLCEYKGKDRLVWGIAPNDELFDWGAAGLIQEKTHETTTRTLVRENEQGKIVAMHWNDGGLEIPTGATQQEETIK